MTITRPVTAAPPIRRSGVLEFLIRTTGAILHPSITWKWLQLLKTHPLLMELLPLCPALPSKIHRRFLSRRLDCAQCAALLETHYDIMLASGFAELVKQTVVQPVPLCAFISKSSVFYRLELSTAGGTSNTGELVLRLTSRGFCIYTATFIFGMHQGRRVAIVGGMSGMLRTGSSMGIKRVTRDLYGLRPKDLMVSLVQEIGDFFCCEKTILIGNCNKLRDRSWRRKQVCRKSSDYDRTWRELNALRRQDGDFELPCVTSVSNIAAWEGGRTPARRTLLINSIHIALRRRLASERDGTLPSEPSLRMSA